MIHFFFARKICCNNVPLIEDKLWFRHYISCRITRIMYVLILHLIVNVNWLNIFSCPFNTIQIDSHDCVLSTKMCPSHISHVHAYWNSYICSCIEVTFKFFKMSKNELNLINCKNNNPKQGLYIYKVSRYKVPNWSFWMIN